MENDEYLQLIGISTSILSIYKITKELKKRKEKVRLNRRFWVNPYLQERRAKGRFYTDFTDMRDFSPEFKRNLHMDINSFDELFERLKTKLQPKRLTRPDAIDPKQGLAYTLEYLAGGPHFERYSASTHRISASSSANIIYKTCKIIYEELISTEFPTYTKNNWIEIANEYKSKWNFPNCVVSIDGKHVRIKCPPNAGSLYYNFKRFHSIILMAVADANYKFTFIDVGSPGADGDINVFAKSDVGSKILQDDRALELPPDATINGEEIPFFFIGDDAFPILKRLMKPYSTKKHNEPFTNQEKVFNYRLSRARRTVENAFGILVMRWACMTTEFQCSPSKVKVIVAACCALHNYLMRKSSTYFNVNTADHFDQNGNLVEGEWRSFEQLQPININRSGRQQQEGKRLREIITNYVNDINPLPFQYNRAHCN